MSWSQLLFVTLGGLRGALSLILVADLIVSSDFHTSAVVGERRGHDRAGVCQCRGGNLLGMRRLGAAPHSVEDIPLLP